MQPSSSVGMNARVHARTCPHMQRRPWAPRLPLHRLHRGLSDKHAGLQQCMPACTCIHMHICEGKKKGVRVQEGGLLPSDQN
eukprot:364538-Chlamydomonas_euryale.AAC.5